jgi:hypothetical protein
MNNWYGTASRVTRKSIKSGDGERGFNGIKKSSEQKPQDSKLSFPPKTPATPQELDIPASVAEDLMLRYLYTKGGSSLRELSRSIKLSCTRWERWESTSGCLSEKSQWNVTALKLNKAKSIINRIGG